ncbi:hypothetical protein I4U23_023863 [Adineta vaga]|nr:hypothetical protein I4U23_023863 [Adineta vaga]
MASTVRVVDQKPTFVINICSSEDNNNDEHIKKPTTCSSKSNLLTRSLTLPNYGQAYKDLSGTIHYSSSNSYKNSFTKSHSYPNNYLLHEKSSGLQSSLSAINCGIGLLDPYNGTQSPGGSSSRYSLYGSFFDLSESGYHPSLMKTDNKLLTIDGKPLLIVDNSSRFSMNACQDKCKDWLTRINSM